MSKWQPIETAPRDGTHILAIRVSDDANYLDAGYMTNANEIYTVYWSKHWLKDGAFMSNGCCDGVTNLNATHWMPLPQPPEENKK